MPEEEKALEMIRFDCRTIKYMAEEQKTLKVCVEAVRRRLFMAVYAPKALLAAVEAAVKECRNEIL